MYNMQTEENIILYYPTIRIEDGEWLRNALLYWDKVASIVPQFAYTESNSIEVEYLSEAGLYEPIYTIELQGNQQLCRAFCKQVKKNLKQCRKRCNNKGNMPKQSRIHLDKMPDDLLDYLKEEKFVEWDKSGVWFKMNEFDSEVYMATLAKYLARAHGNVEIGTDIYRTFLYPYNNGKANKQIYLDVAMQEILPVPNTNIPISDIIDFKHNYRKQLDRFRCRLDQFRWSLEVCENNDQIQERVHGFQKEIQDNLNEIEELMGSRGIKKQRKALRTLFPIGAETAIALWASQGKLSAPQSVLANAGVQVLAHVFDGEETEIAEDKAYLFAARNEKLILPFHRCGHRSNVN